MTNLLLSSNILIGAGFLTFLIVLVVFVLRSTWLKKLRTKPEQKTQVPPPTGQTPTQLPTPPAGQPTPTTPAAPPLPTTQPPVETSQTIPQPAPTTTQPQTQTVQPTQPSQPGNEQSNLAKGNKIP